MGGRGATAGNIQGSPTCSPGRSRLDSRVEIKSRNYFRALSSIYTLYYRRRHIACNHGVQQQLRREVVHWARGAKVEAVA